MSAEGIPLRWILVCVFAIAFSKAFFLDNLPDLPKPKIPDIPKPTLPDLPKPTLPDVITDPFNKIIFSNKCMEDLGCFYTGPPFYHPILRPISIAPYDLKDMQTKFLLFTPDNRENGTYINATEKSLTESPFRKDLPIKFITHGYLTVPEADDDRHVMKEALLDHGDYNVIITDWSKANQRPYMQAVSNARVVGAQIAQLCRKMKEVYGISFDDVHLIGHSLGAHISGFAGEKMKTLGRISGLDPAGPYFRSGEPEIRLDDTDAKFLDIIHSDIGNIAFEGLGFKQAIGDQDFYPNGGENQPGCEPTLLNFTVAGIDVTFVGTGEGITSLLATSCNHNRPYKFYTASIDNSKCKFLATECEDYEKFEKGECNNNTKIEMGFHAKPIPNLPKGKKYYVNTSPDPPYCISEEKNNSTSSRKES